ncbi:MAG: hypothetical protein E7K72_04950 [Roseomonas mucosa]|uniref:hypothetical protein n=1 Tax=Roseomonas mucosa TaxID=207340 RepID=UPI0011157291|nr:hypothetical protein [Roseomonas mucosa]MBS5903079.1 hypothetical protein [Acetobacteraceae bacterium]MCG7352044.1 hypothetical protein [Roseomonas mucosa]MCG7356548.1 hypothetical protein [Roseomonas mucosa]MDT8277332.1 hypothetical protein [Roseomonas mucosa]MDT8291357.1 hypothetical protein [Roseomonas mucosa]
MLHLRPEQGEADAELPPVFFKAEGTGILPEFLVARGNPMDFREGQVGPGWVSEGAGRKHHERFLDGCAGIHGIIG